MTIYNLATHGAQILSGTHSPHWHASGFRRAHLHFTSTSRRPTKLQDLHEYKHFIYLRKKIVTGWWHRIPSLFCILSVWLTAVSFPFKWQRLVVGTNRQTAVKCCYSAHLYSTSLALFWEEHLSGAYSVHLRFEGFLCFSLKSFFSLGVWGKTLYNLCETTPQTKAETVVASLNICYNNTLRLFWTGVPALRL